MMEYVFRFALFLAMHTIWLCTQKLLYFSNTENKLIDRLIENKFVDKCNAYLRKPENHGLCKWIFIITSLMIDASYIVFIIQFIFFQEYRYFSLLFCGLITRQVCQYFARFPHPKNVIWFDPGFPSFCVTYEVSNDYFFSGHTYCSLVFGLMFWNMGLPITSIVLVTTEIGMIILFKAHYFVDIYAALMSFLFFAKCF